MEPAKSFADEAAAILHLTSLPKSKKWNNVKKKSPKMADKWSKTQGGTRYRRMNGWVERGYPRRECIFNCLPVPVTVKEILVQQSNKKTAYRAGSSQI